MIRPLLQLHAQLPYYPGKWRVVESLLSAAGLTEEPRTPVEATRQGLRWRLHGGCRVQRTLYWCGAWDVRDTAALMRGLGPGAVFGDFGSYFGYYALLAARSGARAYAFEPVPGNFALLDGNRRLNPSLDVRVRQMALSDRVGVAHFEPPGGENLGRGHLAESGGIEVETITLDLFSEQEKWTRLDAAKIDVEGAELDVLRGAKETLKRLRPRLLVEFNPPCLARFGESIESLSAALRDLGYGLHRVDGSAFDGLRAGESYTNVLCLPR